MRKAGAVTVLSWVCQQNTGHGVQARGEDAEVAC
jgi:hypothetical protein